MKAFFLRIISTFVALFLLIPAGVSKTEKYDVRDPETCVLNFSVLSDSHVETTNFTRFKVFAHALQDVRKNKSGNDAVVFLGDNTMNGQVLENMLFHGAVNVWMKGETVLPVMGNHDIGNGQGDYKKLENRWFDFTETILGQKTEHPYYYKVIDGCYFIVLGPEAQEVYEMMMTEAQFSWLEDVLAKAAESGKPCFVFEHFPTDDVSDETGKYTDRLIDMLAAYNEEHDLFCFVGHTHMPLYLFWSFHDSDGYPETYLPRLTELAGTGDDAIMKNTGVGVEVEVYENEVLIRGRDFFRGEWRYEEDEGAYTERTYPLKHAYSAGS